MKKVEKESAIKFAAILPHPPILVPQIGKKEQVKVKKTKQALAKVFTALKKIDFDTLVIISPHGLIGREAIPVLAASKFFGNFGAFGAPSVKLNFKGDLRLAEAIVAAAESFGLRIQVSDKALLDYGTLVPLYFLEKSRQVKKIVPIGISYSSKQTLFTFGQAIAAAGQTIKRKIAIIASGDLAHRVKKGSPSGNIEVARVFDETIVKAVKKMKPKEILELSHSLAEEAGECGLRPISILLGAINELPLKATVLSYEVPFGVGYLVATFEAKKR